MAFYDNVKDSVRGKETDEEESSVSFDQLIANAKEAEDEREEEPDETQIEDLSGPGSGGNKEYGDPSSIELSEDDPVQSSEKREKKSEPVSEQEKLRVEAKQKKQAKGTQSEKKRVAVKKPEDGKETTSGGEEQLMAVLKDIRDQQAEMVSLLKRLMDQD